MRKQPLDFPLVERAKEVTIIYRRSYGDPSVVLLFMYQNRKCDVFQADRAHLSTFALAKVVQNAPKVLK